jgi:PilZ domain
MSQVETLPAPSARPRGEQRRRHPRFPCEPTTFGLVQASPDTPLELAGVRDISQSGVGLLFRRRLNPGRTVVLNLFNARRNFACRLVMRVVYASAQPDGTFRLGGTFTQELSPAEVDWLR